MLEPYVFSFIFFLIIELSSEKLVGPEMQVLDQRI